MQSRDERLKELNAQNPTYRRVPCTVLQVDEKFNWPKTMLEIEYAVKGVKQVRIVDAHSVKYRPEPVTAEWELLCKRTDDPKLGWIERELDKLGIRHKREGRSFHADHCLYVEATRVGDADAILQRRVGRYTVDDIRDDHPRWEA